MTAESNTTTLPRVSDLTARLVSAAGRVRQADELLHTELDLRDELVVQAHEDGMRPADIAKAIGVRHGRIYAILAAH